MTHPALNNQLIRVFRQFSIRTRGVLRGGRGGGDDFKLIWEAFQEEKGRREKKTLGTKKAVLWTKKRKWETP